MHSFDPAAWREAIFASSLTPATRLACLVASLLVDPYGYVKVAKRDLAEKTGFSRRTVLSHLRRAEAADLLELLPRSPAGMIAARLVHAQPAPASAPSSAIVLEPGDPRWEAWLAHFRAVPARSNEARNIARRREPLAVDADWPPPSASIEPTPFGSYSIAWGTPEFAAWLQHWRRTGRIRQAQAVDVGRHPISERHRWPPLPEAALERAEA